MKLNPFLSSLVSCNHMIVYNTKYVFTQSLCSVFMLNKSNQEKSLSLMDTRYDFIRMIMMAGKSYIPKSLLTY